MSRVSIMQDTAAHICWKYCHNDLSRVEKQKVRDIVVIVVPEKRVKQFIKEIAYRIGYSNSKFTNTMSETTYKKKKLWARNLIVEELEEKDAKITI